MDNLLYEELDLTDAVAIHHLFEKYHPEAVIHLAAEAQPDTCEINKELADNVNVDATALLLYEASRCKAFFTYISTDFVFPGSGGPYKEEDAVGPVNYYGLTKLRSEELVQKYEHPWAIVRTVLVYGNTLAGTRTNIISWVRGELDKKKPIRVVGDQVRTPTYAVIWLQQFSKITELRAKESGIFRERYSYAV
jgi:dTDP-4-dehydrorhamnose reductase